MSDRIDYLYNAQERVKVALKDPDHGNALVTAQIATAEALIALTQQQRIANLIAVAQMEGGPYKDVNGWIRDEYGDDQEDANVYLRREIREGLGLS